MSESLSVPPVFGFADLHCHPMAHRAFGGQLFAGLPDGDPADALRRCDALGTNQHGFWGTGVGGEARSLVLAFLEPASAFGHGACGYPSFSAWPRFDTRVHQQMFVDSIRRSYDGGLRLLCSLAVNNELLADEMRSGRPHDDQNAIDAQVLGMRELVARHGWMGIATSAAEARQLIDSGRLAVVLGVEVDSLDGCRRARGAPLTDAAIDDIVTWLRADLGVSMVTPLHLADNELGGCAIYSDLFNVLNHHLRGEFYRVATSTTGVEYRLGESTTREIQWGVRLYEVTRNAHYPRQGYGLVPGGHANQRGLTARGERFVKALMRAGMMVDVDHMSERCTDQVLALAEQFDYPLLSSHTSFRALALEARETGTMEKRAHEGMKTDVQLRRLLGLGGVVAPIARQLDVKSLPSCPVLNDCAGSSKSWAQAYTYAVEALRSVGRGGVAIGTDFNGLNGQPGPRFGPDAAMGLKDDPMRERHRDSQQRAQQRHGRLPYGGTMHGTHAPFQMSRLGDRPFDINVDGLAHFGMLPDFLRELLHVRLPEHDLDPFFTSAEAFLQAWEKCERQKALVSW